MKNDKRGLARRSPASKSARRVAVGTLIAATIVTLSGLSPSAASGATDDKLTATARGVTADTITIGFTYPDLDALTKTGFVRISHGPYDEIVPALVDDINKRGGVLGRKLKVFVEKYSVLGNAEQTAACTKLTEDDKVFAVIGGLVGTNNECVTQQHETALVQSIGSSLNAAALAKARAPWVEAGASDERSIEALVQILKQQKSLEGKNIAVYGVGDGKPLIDLMTKSLKKAGYSVKETALNDAAGTDIQALNTQDKVIANRFNDAKIDTVFVVNTVPPGAVFDSVGFHPTMYTPNAALVQAGAVTNPYAAFPLVAGLLPSANVDAAYNSPSMQRCRKVWKKASGHDVKPTSVELKEGKSTGYTALVNACAGLDIFVAAAKAAGPKLTYETWEKGVASLGSIELPTSPVSSFGPDKPDAQDSFQLAKFNPAWKPDSSATQMLGVGKPITAS